MVITSTQIYILLTAQDLRHAAQRHPIGALIKRVEDLLPNVKLPVQSGPLSRFGYWRESFVSLPRVIPSTARQSRVSATASAPQAGFPSSRHSLTASPTNFSTASRRGRAPSFGWIGRAPDGPLPACKVSSNKAGRCRCLKPAFSRIHLDRTRKLAALAGFRVLLPILAPHRLVQEHPSAKATAYEPRIKVFAG